MENTKYAWGDNAQTLNTGANQLRMLKSNFANLSRTIGNIFLPTITAILPYINGLVMALQRLAETIANLVGIKGFDWGGIGGGDSDVLSYMYDDAETLADNLDNATDSAKKLKNQLMGFDEINKLSDNTDSDSQNKGLDASGLALLESAFDKVFSDYQVAWDKAFDEMDNKAVTVADRIEKAFTSGNFFDWQKSYKANQKTHLVRLSGNLPMPVQKSSVLDLQNLSMGLLTLIHLALSPKL